MTIQRQPGKEFGGLSPAEAGKLGAQRRRENREREAEAEAAEAAGLVSDVDEGKIIRALKAKAENGDVPASRELREWWEVKRRTDSVKQDRRLLELLSPTTRKLIEVDLKADGLPEDLVDLIEFTLQEREES
jgi:hypothetical protein